MFAIDRDYVKSALPARDPAGHKGTFGKVCLLGGSGVLAYIIAALIMPDRPY